MAQKKKTARKTTRKKSNKKQVVVDPLKEMNNIIAHIEIEEALEKLFGKYVTLTPKLATMQGHRDVVKGVMKYLVRIKVLSPIKTNKKK